MMGVGAVKRDIKAILLARFAGLVAGACSMAIGEFVAVYTQLDVETARIKRENNNITNEKETAKAKEKLPSPFQASVASAFSFLVGGLVPLMAAAFITDYKVMVIVMVAVSILSLVVFGGVGAVLGKTSAARSCSRMLLGGRMAMAITYAVTKLIGYSGVKI